MLMGSNPKNNEDPSCPISGDNLDSNFGHDFYRHVEILKASENLWLLGTRI